MPGRAPLGVNEAGLYDLILQSRKPEAREFKDWVTGTVLPAIRKDGAYIMGEENVATGEMGEEAFILKAYEMLKRKVERLAQEKEQLSLENKEMAPKAVVFDNCVALRQESLATFVRTLEGVNTMAIKGDLAELGYLYRTVGTSKYRVYAKPRFNLTLRESFIFRVASVTFWIPRTLHTSFARNHGSPFISTTRIPLASALPSWKK